MVCFVSVRGRSVLLVILTIALCVHNPVPSNGVLLHRCIANMH